VVERSYTTGRQALRLQQSNLSPFHPEGIQESSRWLSAATPPEGKLYGCSKPIFRIFIPKGFKKVAGG